jgi:hypothetical protein
LNDSGTTPRITSSAVFSSRVVTLHEAKLHVAVREHRALGLARAPRGVDDRREVDVDPPPRGRVLGRGLEPPRGLEHLRSPAARACSTARDGLGLRAGRAGAGPDGLGEAEAGVNPRWRDGGVGDDRTAAPASRNMYASLSAFTWRVDHEEDRVGLEARQDRDRDGVELVVALDQHPVAAGDAASRSAWPTRLARASSPRR